MAVSWIRAPLCSLVQQTFIYAWLVLGAALGGKWWQGHETTVWVGKMLGEGGSAAGRALGRGRVEKDVALELG